MAICDTISVERPPRCQFFFPDPSANQKPGKNNGFLLWPTKKLGSSEATKHPKKRCYCDLTHTRNTLNYGDFGSPCCPPGSVIYIHTHTKGTVDPGGLPCFFSYFTEETRGLELLM